MNRTHIVSISFDDGFRRSSFRTAEIFEKHGLRACLNVVAAWSEPAAHHGADMGSWADWNELQRRGHEVACHTYDHTDLSRLPLVEAEAHIDRAIEAFRRRLEGFDPSRSVYSFAYNASTPEIESYALSKFLAVRTQGESALNEVPTANTPTLVRCWSHGPEVMDAVFEASLNEFLAGPGGWWVFNAHGLDGEGWGPMTSQYLDEVLTRLVREPHVIIAPVGAVVAGLSA